MPKKYMDQEKLLDSHWWKSIKDDFDRARARDIILAFPAADVVEVVRCKDCVYAEELSERDKQMYCENCIMCTAINPFGNKVPMEKESYCSFGRKCGCGERRE